MASRLTEVIIDCHDLERMAAFWCAALGYERANSGDGWLAIRPPGGAPSDEVLVAAAQAPAIAFVLVPEDKSAKNRVHIDITPTDCSQTAEVERMLELGAAHTDVGQRQTPWVVLVDPEDNEFCVMPELDSASS